jgi:hypothetical protein
MRKSLAGVELGAGSPASDGTAAEISQTDHVLDGDGDPMSKKKKPKGVTFVLRPTCGRS